MKKGIFCWLMLIILSIASVDAQVRIGGTDNPNPSAILDLNVDNTDAGNTKGLALPRVTLTSTTGNGGITNAIKGLLVYNIEGAVPAGTYYFDGSNWNRLSSAAQMQADWDQGTLTAVDYIKNKPTLGDLAALSSVDSTKLGIGAVTSYKILDGTIENRDIKDATITGEKLANGSVTSPKLAIGGNAEGNILAYTGNSWVGTPAVDALFIRGTLEFEFTENEFYAYCDYPEGCSPTNILMTSAGASTNTTSWNVESMRVPTLMLGCEPARLVLTRTLASRNGGTSTFPFVCIKI
jgi:hypothetical protein